MEVGASFFALIKSLEGYKATAYRDDAGVWTIGYGTTRINGEPVVPGMEINVPVAEALLRGDTKTATRIVNRTVRAKLAQNQFDALVSFVYNIGEGQWLDSTLLRELNAGRPVVQDYLARFKFVTDPVTKVKKISNGLINRRAKEWAVFNSIAV